MGYPDVPRNLTRVPPDQRKELPTVSGPALGSNQTISTQDYRGKVVVINFWASWCRPCRDEAPILQRAWRKHRNRGLVVVGIDYNDFDGDARSFARKVGWTYPLVRDRSGNVLARYGGTGVPETYVVDRRGRLVGERLQGTIKGSEDAFSARVERAFAK